MDLSRLAAPEQRFAARLGLNAKTMLSIALTKAEHQAFTNAWRTQIGRIGSLSKNTTANATKADIEAAAKYIYQKYPFILKALGL